MANIPNLLGGNIDLQGVVEGLTGHASAGGLVGAGLTLVGGQIASSIIQKAVAGGALSVVDPLGLATHLANGVAPGAAAPAAPAVAATPTLPQAIFATLTDAQKVAFLQAGGKSV